MVSKLAAVALVLPLLCGDYYLRLVLSAQTQDAHDKALADFAAFVRGYSKTPKKP